MPTLHANDIDICYESWGSTDDPPLLLVMGLGAQMVVWSPEFVMQLVNAGFRVIRYDNRDVGLSTKTEGTPATPAEVVAAREAGNPIPPPYTLSDMANDGMALLTALGIDQAHIVGGSMGGMIVQHMAMEHPNRVLSMTSIMSTTGNPKVGESTPEAMTALLAPPPTDRDGAIEHAVKLSKIISGPLWQEGPARERCVEVFDRCFFPQGTQFQFAAIQNSGNRTKALGTITAPTLVIHGQADSLLGVSGGHATHEAIPGSTLLVLEEMGHDMPPPLLPQMVEAIAKVAGIA